MSDRGQDDVVASDPPHPAQVARATMGCHEDALEAGRQRFGVTAAAGTDGTRCEPMVDAGAERRAATRGGSPCRKTSAEGAVWQSRKPHFRDQGCRNRQADSPASIAVAVTAGIPAADRSFTQPSRARVAAGVHPRSHGCGDHCCAPRDCARRLRGRDRAGARRGRPRVRLVAPLAATLISRLRSRVDFGSSLLQRAQAAAGACRVDFAASDQAGPARLPRPGSHRGRRARGA